MALVAVPQAAASRTMTDHSAAGTHRRRGGGGQEVGVWKRKTLREFGNKHTQSDMHAEIINDSDYTKKNLKIPSNECATKHIHNTVMHCHVEDRMVTAHKLYRSVVTGVWTLMWRQRFICTSKTFTKK